jgi:NADH dehydrogenase
MGVRPHVVIVGAGFGGLAVARGLERLPVEVTLIDRNNFTTFQPLLYQVATAGLNAADVAHPVRGLFHRQRNLRMLVGEVTGVDWDTREVVLADHQAVPFDHLVLATGAVARWFGVPGAAEYAVPLYTLEDAVEVRNHVVSRFEAADADPSLVDRGELNFVVVGGGPTGVEMAGALAELFAVVFKRDYPSLGVGRARVILVETRDRLLEPFHASSQQAALDALRARQVEVRLEETVDEVAPDHVRFASGEILPARTVIWAAGVRAHPVARAMGLPTLPSGRVEVAADLSVPGPSGRGSGVPGPSGRGSGDHVHQGVWAVGDVAAPRARRGSGVLPQLAPVAMQSGSHVAKQIGRLAEGKATQPFRFHDKGMMATIGRRAAIAELPGRVRLHGTLAWLAWLGLHILYLAGVRNRASVLLNWAWGYLTWDRGPRIILRCHPDLSAGMATERAKTAVDNRSS